MSSWRGFVVALCVWLKELCFVGLCGGLVVAMGCCGFCDGCGLLICCGFVVEEIWKRIMHSDLNPYHLISPLCFLLPFFFSLLFPL
jgi:hypothetical protein